MTFSRKRGEGVTIYSESRNEKMTKDGQGKNGTEGRPVGGGETI